MYELRSFENGFEYLEIQNEAAHAKIALQGAHIFEYQRKDEKPLLWLSKESKFENGTVIRGGIPLCWPRFGNLDRSLPQHGFARTMLFKLIGVKEINKTLTQLHLQLKSSQKSREIWDYDFILDVFFNISDRLEMSIKTTNMSAKEFLLTQAFHTYFHVDDIEAIRIEGLEDVAFLDTLSDTKDVENKPIQIDREIDRVYGGVQKDICLREGSKNIKIHAENSNSAIVWNPWIEKCSKMSGMQSDAYKKFVCIESANAFDDFRIVKAGESVSLSVLLIKQN
jgi:glucose-6-phosphate 1-epimerase